MTSETTNFDYLALKNEGNALYSAGDFLGAVQKYSKALKLCSDNNTDRTTLLKNRAAAYLNLQQYQKVIEDTTAALEITPSDIKALYRRCQAYEQLGKYNEAFEDARAVNRLNPQNSAIQPYLRRLQEIKPVVVEESTKTVLSETSNLDYLALKEEGNVLYSAGDFPAAVKKYSKCLKLCMDKNTDRSTLLKNRAAAYLNLREYQKVVDDTTAALEITPNDIKALYRRCQAYEQLGKYNEAFEDARAVNRLNPQNSAIQPYLRRLQEIVNESNDDALDINSLPNEIILKIFGYLKQNQLGQIARVCSRWNVMTRSPTLWKKVDVTFHWSHNSHNTMTRYFVKMLPSCVTSIRLHYSNLDWTEQLNFEELCVGLQRSCPHLEMLILEHVHLSDNFPSVIGLCNEFLPGLKILIFHHSTFSDSPTKREFDSISKIEVLDVSDCNLGGFQELQFSKMPQLRVLNLRNTRNGSRTFRALLNHGIPKIEVLDVSDCNLGRFQELQFSKMPELRVLNLRNTSIGSRTFRALQNHGHNLEELYLCGTFVSEDDLRSSNSVFSHLKIICLHCQSATRNAIVSIIQSCRSLQKVYIREYFVEKNLIPHPFFECNRGKYNIVEGVAEHHSHNLDYSYKKN